MGRAALQAPAAVVSTQQGAATAVALAETDGQPTAYFVGHNATLKILSLSTNTQVGCSCYVAAPCGHCGQRHDHTLHTVGFLTEAYGLAERAVESMWA